MANHGPSWRDHRRFALMTLRNFGLGKQSMEDRILGEVEHVAAELEKSNGKARAYFLAGNLGRVHFGFRFRDISGDRNQKMIH